MQAVETKREILVWTDTSLNSMRFIGPPFTFGLQQLASNITIISPMLPLLLRTLCSGWASTTSMFTPVKRSSFLAP